MSTQLLTDIEAFLSETGMTPYWFGMQAARNGRLVERLRAGETPQGKPVRIWPETETQIRAFMLSERQRRRTAA